MEYCIGQIVRSKAGRDNGTLYVVISTDGEYVYVSDGMTHKLDKPKKKKIKHIQGSYEIINVIEEQLKNGSLENHMIRKILAQRSS